MQCLLMEKTQTDSMTFCMCFHSAFRNYCYEVSQFEIEVYMKD